MKKEVQALIDDTTNTRAVLAEALVDTQKDNKKLEKNLADVGIDLAAKSTQLESLQKRFDQSEKEADQASKNFNKTLDEIHGDMAAIREENIRLTQELEAQSSTSESVSVLHVQDTSPEEVSVVPLKRPLRQTVQAGKDFDSQIGSLKRAGAPKSQLPTMTDDSNS